MDGELAAFCEREHGPLVGVLTVVTGDHSLAEELAQETLIRVCERWSEVRVMGQPRAWIRRVAINLASSRFRRRAAEARAVRRHGAPLPAPEPDRADAVVVLDAVAALPARQRTVVALRFYVGLSVAATASEMGCAEGTVKSLTSKAVARLRTVIDEEVPSCPTT